MHGHKRADYKARQRENAAKYAAKAQQWNVLSQTVQSPQTPPADVLGLTEKLVTVNPDPLYLWSLRREHLSSINDAWIESELQLTAAALRANPKAYGAWLHRKWILSTTASQQPQNATILQGELALLKLFLQLDERNFHAWNYRRFVVSLLLAGRADDADWKAGPFGAPQIVLTGNDKATIKDVADNNNSDEQRNVILQAEWDFTDSKIQDNFSNYSAIHYRTLLMDWKWQQIQQQQTADDFWRQEWSLVQNAVFTEPDDQTAWWYAQYLVQCLQKYELLQLDVFQSLLQEQLGAFQELAAEVPESKWPLLGCLVLLQQGQVVADKEESQQSQRQLLESLVTLDPDRQGRYQYLLQQLDTNNENP